MFKSRASNSDSLQQPRNRWAMFGKGGPGLGRPPKPHFHACGSHLNSERPHQSCERQQGTQYNRQQPWFQREFSRPTPQKGTSSRLGSFINTPQNVKKTQTNQNPQSKQWSSYGQSSMNRFQSYCDAAKQNLKPKPNPLFNELHPRKFQKRKPYTAQNESLPQAFWEYSLKNQRQWQYGKTRNSLVNWFLQNRSLRWNKMASGLTQKRLLDSPEALTVPGVIYAIVFGKSKEVYIGQTVNSSWHRWRQHLLARSKDSKETSLQNVLQNEEKAANACIIPLEVILMPGMQKEGHHTEEFIAEFRRRALIREQEWIRFAKSSFSRLLNIVKHIVPPDSQKRRMRRSKLNESYENNLHFQRVPNSRYPENQKRRKEPPNWTKFITVTNDGITLDHTTPGEHFKVRKVLADLLSAQEQGADTVSILSNWNKDLMNKVISFLINQLDETETTMNRSRILFHFIANASLKRASAAQQTDHDTHESNPLKKNLPRHQPKKDNSRTWWLRVPWSREEFATCRLQQFLLSKDVIKLHPLKHVAEDTRVSYSLNKPLGVTMCNFTKVCKEPLPAAPLSEPEKCPCQNYRTKHSLCYMGHVITTDPEAFKDPSLKQLWQQGRKHRLPANPGIAMDDLRKGLDEYIEKVCFTNKLDASTFISWKSKLIAYMENHISAIPDVNWVSQGGLSRQGLKELRKAQSCMVIGPTDKSSHDFMMACKDAYLSGLRNELTSETYVPSTISDADIFESHKVLTEQLGRIPVAAHPYLYGAGKLHKEVASMRWIAGCSKQLVHKTRTRQFYHAATSISAVSSALGAALRFCMYQLEQKDIAEFRPKLIKRYWIATSVDTVAKHIKVNQKELAKENVWTVDFTTMYTKLPLNRIMHGVSKAVKEAFEFYARQRIKKSKTSGDTELSYEDIRFNFQWSNYGDATLSIVDDGPFDMNNILAWMEKVLFGTYLKQGENSATLQQVVGVPMGGKSSSELANLYCYSVESAMIDKLLSTGSEEIARSFFHTFRYIDDILGFGLCQLQLLDYQMEYKQTNEQAQSAVFLGMRISTAGDFVQLSLEPKGAGWRWKPQRYVEWSSIHTMDTKRMLLKGLLVRAGTITNSIKAFKEAVEYYVDGLYARGFTKKALLDGLESYLRDYWIPFPFAANDIRYFFRGLVGRKFQRKETNWTEKKAPQKATSEKTSTKGALLCGLKAINHVLASIDRMPVRRDLLDDLAAHIAQEEAALRMEKVAVETLPHKEGNYHVSVMELALRHLADMEVKIWKLNDAENADAFIVGDGSHWQAVVKICGKWQLLDQRTEYVADLGNLLRLRSRQGIVLSCTIRQNTNDMDTDRVSKKRIFDDTTASPDQPLMITLGPTHTTDPSARDSSVPESKKAKSDDISQASTSAMLLHMHTPYIHLQGDTQQSNRTLTPVVIVPSELEPADDWKNVVVGSTCMLYNSALNKYRCSSQGCTFESGKPAGVAVHFARYCKFNQKEVDAISIDSGDTESNIVDVKSELDP